MNECDYVMFIFIQHPLREQSAITTLKCMSHLIIYGHSIPANTFNWMWDDLNALLLILYAVNLL